MVLGRRQALAFAVAAVCFTLSRPAVAQEGAPWFGHWEGAILVSDNELAISVDFAEAEDGSLTGVISIPAQGAFDLPLAVSLEEDGLVFSIPGVPGEPTFTGRPSEDAQSLSGDILQGGVSLPFQLTRADEGEASGVIDTPAVVDTPAGPP